MRTKRCLLIPLLLALCSAVTAGSSLAAEKPSVLLIVADDLGFSDLGCYGGEIDTPNLNALADSGLRFTQFYNTARCWPTRTAILTGYYPQQVGRDSLPNIRGGSGGVRPKWAQLLPRMLKPLGYRSYTSGKWHIDGKPLEEGFDHSLTMDDHNRFFYPDRFTIDDVPQTPIERGTDYYTTTAIASHAIECLQKHAAEHSDKPFFQYLAFTSPHFPLHAPAKDIAKYKGRYDAGWDVARQARWERLQAAGIVTGQLSELEPEIGPPYRHFSDPALEKLGPREIDGELPWDELTAEQQEFQAQKMEIHAAMVDRMDQEIGRVVDQVKAMGAYENTLIMFVSDNGASAEIMIRGDGHDNDAPLGSADSYLCLGPGWSKAANTPFRRHKTWVHEGGAATPMIAHWPKGITVQGELRKRPSHVIDVAPTILQLAGGTWPKEVDGEQVVAPMGSSFASAFGEDVATREQPLWWLHEGNRAIRVGDYKLVAAKDEKWQLYNMASDRAETSDIASGMPEKAAELEAQWNAITAEFESLAKARQEK